MRISKGKVGANPDHRGGDDFGDRKAAFFETAAVVAADLTDYFSTNPVSFLYIPCSGELFGTIYALISFMLGAIVAALYSAGLLDGIIGRAS